MPALLLGTRCATVAKHIQHESVDQHQSVLQAVSCVQLKQHMLELQQTRDSLKEQIKSAAAQEEEWDAMHCE